MEKQRMLLVEDHESTRRTLRRILTFQGWEIAEAGTVAEALAILASEQCFDWVILDLMLPDGDGETVLKRVRDDALKTRVMVCTATYDPARLDAVFDLGPDAVVQKPFNIMDVCRSLGSGAGRKQEDLASR
ncbi:MAG TPA: response regulator [Isosphaeraceae bacterium]|jgi:CheY-like chemotaxis protein|nr:response regulator [Isosphaeraceae bacterium]